MSYTWGQEPDLHPLFLHGNKRLIRSNLFHALQRIMLRSGSINIWIDSICINQEYDLERNSQVRQMADIYRNATGVLIWLGEEDSTSKLAMDLIEKIVQRDFYGGVPGGRIMVLWPWPTFWRDLGFAVDGFFKRLPCQAIQLYTAATVKCT